MRDVFGNDESDRTHQERRLSSRKHVPNFQYAFWTMERERERAVRFSNLEIEVLVDLIKTHIIVEERRIDCTTNAVKKKAWETITNEFWSRTSSNRTEFQLLKKWKNLKHAARKYEAAINSKECTPGKGPPPRSPILEEVLFVIKREQEAIATQVNDTVCLPTRIKCEEDEEEEEEDEGGGEYTSSFNNLNVIDNRLISNGNANWEQQCIRSHEQAPVNDPVPSQRLDDVTLEPLNFDIKRQRSFANKSGKRTDSSKRPAEREEISSNELVDVCSSISPEVPTNGSSVRRVTQLQTRTIEENCRPESSDLPHDKLVNEKELALKSAQLALLEKENKIRELDIKIRQEQLTDIIIRRQHEQELHELRKRRMLQGLNDG